MPNIILFITHDLGQYLSVYDSIVNPVSIKTPNLDRIAKKGVYFTNYFCSAPQCSPSRASIQTGKYPHQHGVMGLIKEGWKLDTSFTMPKFFNQLGYTTNLIGFQHETKDVDQLGYSYISKRKMVYKYSCSLIEGKFIEFLEKNAFIGKPFFLNIGVCECHRPFRLFGTPIDFKRVKNPPYLPDTKVIRKEMAEFYGSVIEVDKCVGKLYKKLESIGINKNTLFIFTTDHGIDMPRAKCTLYDPGLKTALLMYYPDSNLLNGGKIINSLISNIDLLPTLIDLFGFPEKYPDIEGKSFLHLLNEESEKFRTEIFAEKTYHTIYDPIRCIRTEKYKYIRNFEGSDVSNHLFHIPNDTHSYKSIRSIKTELIGLRPKEELYDLEKDPIEKNNLIKDPNYKDIVRELRAKLEYWMKRTNDPLIKGRVDPPPTYIKRRKSILKQAIRKRSVQLIEYFLNYRPIQLSTRKIIKYAP